MRAWNALNGRIVACERCPRLRDYCRQIAAEKRRAFCEWDYWGRPVPNFGAAKAGLLIVGLAPAAHGANRTGADVHGRSQRRLAVSGAARAGLRESADVGSGRMMA